MKTITKPPKKSSITNQTKKTIYKDTIYILQARGIGVNNFWDWSEFSTIKSAREALKEISNDPEYDKYGPFRVVRHTVETTEEVIAQ